MRASVLGSGLLLRMVAFKDSNGRLGMFMILRRGNSTANGDKETRFPLSNS